MDPRRLLSFARYVLYFAIGLNVCLVGGLLFVAIHVQLRPEIYAAVFLHGAFEAGLPNVRLVLESSSGGWALSEMTSVMWAWLLLRTSLICAVGISMFVKVIQLIREILQGESFFTANLRLFQQLGLLGLLLAMLASFHMLPGPEEVHLRFRLSLGILMFAGFCYVMTAVFREGKDLLNDSNTIV